MSNLEWFRYCWVWQKGRATGHLDCKRKPLKKHEDIVVFSAGTHTYNPQMQKGKKHSRGGARTGPAQVYGNFSDRKTTGSDEYYPLSIISFSTVNVPEHPTQKPTELYAYLICTYTNPGDVVLDFCMGSGTTGVAAITEGRSFIGYELRTDYFEIAKARIEQAQPPLL
jgi:site-specific DNA-methyltransferase (adenine-specific)